MGERHQESRKDSLTSGGIKSYSMAGNFRRPRYSRGRPSAEMITYNDELLLLSVRIFLTIIKHKIYMEELLPSCK